MKTFKNVALKSGALAACFVLLAASLPSNFFGAAESSCHRT